MTGSIHGCGRPAGKQASNMLKIKAVSLNQNPAPYQALQGGRLPLPAKGYPAYSRGSILE